MKRQLSSVAQAAKEIRTELKATYPGIKFKVQSDNYSMGSSIDIYWVDGPTIEQVKEISNKKERVSRCEYTGDILSGGNRYVSTHRTYSESVLTAEIEKVLTKYQHNDLVDYLDRPMARAEVVATQSKYDSTWDLSSAPCIKMGDSVRAHTDSVRSYVYKNLHDISFVNLQVAEVKPVESAVESEVAATVSENNIKNGIEIKFSTKPDRAVIEELKANGFRYSRGQNIWYAARTDDRLIVANNLAHIAATTPAIQPAIESTPNDFSYLLGAATEQLSIELAEMKAEDIDAIPADRLDDAIAATRAQVLALLPADEVEEYLSISAEVVDDSSLSVNDFRQAATSGKVISLAAFSKAIRRESVVESWKGWEVVSTFNVEPIAISQPQPQNVSMLELVTRSSCR
jgi:Large polyvalent protein associated domain 29